MKVTPRVRLPHTGIAAEDAIPRKPVPMDKERLDILVQRLVGVSRSKARGLIHTGQVYGPDGRKLDKPGMRLDVSTLLEIRLAGLLHGEEREELTRIHEILASRFLYGLSLIHI